jgi:hypothetical protein
MFAAEFDQPVFHKKILSDTLDKPMIYAELSDATPSNFAETVD